MAPGVVRTVAGWGRLAIGEPIVKKRLPDGAVINGFPDGLGYRSLGLAHDEGEVDLGIRGGKRLVLKGGDDDPFGADRDLQPARTGG